jgi:WD40 repeat protein
LTIVGYLSSGFAQGISGQEPARRFVKLQRSKDDDIDPIGPHIAFADNGRRLVAAFHKTVRIWNVETGRLVTSIGDQADVVKCISATGDGQMIVSGADQEIRIRDGNGNTLETIRESNPDSAIRWVAVSPDKHVLAWSSVDGMVRLWDFRKKKRIAILKSHDDQLYQVVFSPNGKTLASASNDRSIVLWDVASGKARCRLLGHTDGVIALAYSPDGRILASGGWDACVKIWDIAKEKELRSLYPGTGRVAALAFSPDGHMLAVGGERRVSLWGARNWRRLATITDHEDVVVGLAFDPHGRFLASGDQRTALRVWYVDSLGLPGKTP